MRRRGRHALRSSALCHQLRVFRWHVKQRVGVKRALGRVCAGWRATRGRVRRAASLSRGAQSGAPGRSPSSFSRPWLHPKFQWLAGSSSAASASAGSAARRDASGKSAARFSAYPGTPSTANMPRPSGPYASSISRLRSDSGLLSASYGMVTTERTMLTGVPAKRCCAAGACRKHGALRTAVHASWQTERRFGRAAARLALALYRLSDGPDGRGPEGPSVHPSVRTGRTDGQVVARATSRACRRA